MSGLLQLQANEIEISTAGGSFTVSGIDLMGALALITRNALASPRLMSLMLNGELVNAAEAPNVGLELLTSSPDIAADIIATAAGGYTPETVQVARSLPLAAALQALEAIAELTFSACGGPQQFMALLKRLMTSAGGVITPPTAAQLN